MADKKVSQETDLGFAGIDGTVEYRVIKGAGTYRQKYQDLFDYITTVLKYIPDLDTVITQGHDMPNGLIPIGTDALVSNTGATNVIGIGTSAAKGNNKADVIALGADSLFQNTGQKAIGIGYQAGMNNTGNDNIAIGYQSGQVLGADIISIGTNAAKLNTLDNVIAIGSGSAATSTIGDAIGIGKSALDSATSGATSNVVAIGHRAGQTMSGDDVIALGYQAASGTDGSRLIAIGTGANKNNDESDSVAIGNSALEGSNVGDTVAIGTGAMSNTGQGTDANVIAIGTSAGQSSDPVAIDCVYIGVNAGRNNANRNVIAIGTNAGLSNPSDGEFILASACIRIFSDPTQAASYYSGLTLSSGQTYIYIDQSDDNALKVYQT